MLGGQKIGCMETVNTLPLEGTWIKAKITVGNRWWFLERILERKKQEPPKPPPEEPKPKVQTAYQKLRGKQPETEPPKTNHVPHGAVERPNTEFIGEAPQEKDFDLAKGPPPLYEVLVTKNGEIVDGMHRHAINPDWPVRVLEWVRNREDFLVARISANVRREVPKAERKDQLLELANIQISKGIPQEKVSSELAKKLPFSERYIRELLPRQFKREYQPPITVPKEQIGTSSDLHENVKLPMPEAVAERQEAYAKTVMEAPSESVERLFEWSCEVCGATYQVDWKTMTIKLKEAV